MWKRIQNKGVEKVDIGIHIQIKGLSFCTQRVKITEIAEMDSQHISQSAPQQQTSEDASSGSTDLMAEIERKKLYYLEKIAKEQEKTNNRLHSIIENQKQEFRNHDRMIELLYRIAYNK